MFETAIAERLCPLGMAKGRGQKVYYWYVVASALQSVLTFMATAITVRYALVTHPNAVTFNILLLTFDLER